MVLYFIYWYIIVVYTTDRFNLRKVSGKNKDDLQEQLSQSGSGKCQE